MVLTIGVTAGLENCSKSWGGSKSAQRGLKGWIATTLGLQSLAPARNLGIKGGCPSMPLSTLDIPEAIAPGKKRIHSNGDRRTSLLAAQSTAKAGEGRPALVKPRVFVAAENHVQREALSRVLIQSGEVEVVGKDMAVPVQTEDLLTEETDILILSSRGNGNEDLTAVRKVRTTAPKVQILLTGVTGEEAEFLQCVRA
jgi:hypothetical protein